MRMRVALKENGYDITVRRGALRDASGIFDLSRKVLVVTDSGVPAQYAEAVARQCKNARIFTVKEGEASKSPEVYLSILKEMLDFGMSRADAAVAVGGGVVGDVTGFAAATYMRGINFYNVPTTLLSQVDSSIGGKTAIDFCGVKNVVGAFYQPKAVLIDPDTLDTLPRRQFSSGMAEAIKMAITLDKDLFLKIESGKYDIEDVITGSLKIKADVVLRDEREGGLRRVLNFGHTVGHGIESAEGGRLYHGECVSLGMIPMCGGDARERLVPLLERFDLPTYYGGNAAPVIDALTHDKKTDGDKISVVVTNKPGSFEIIKETPADIAARIAGTWGKR